MTDGWSLTDHACRHCMGRVLKSANGVRCANCGASANVQSESAICGCGITVGRTKPYVCIPNDRPTPEMPSEIVIVLRGNKKG